MEQQMIDRITDLAASGMYEPGSYVKRSDLSTGPIVATPDGGRSFMVETTVPNEDREAFLVTITPV